MPFVPTVFEALEDNLCIALDSLKPGFEVTYFADVDIDYKKAFGKPRISVMVHSGKSGDLLDTNIVLSEESVFVQVCLEARARRGAGGIYDLKNKVVAMLNGLKLDGWDRMVYGDFKYSERTTTGIWVYNILFTTKGINEQAFDDGYPSFALVVGTAI